MEEEKDSLIRKEKWYLGEVGEEVSTAILRNSDRDNVFVVYKSPGTDNYILSVRFPPVEGIQESLIDNFTIRNNNDGIYEITGLSDMYNSIIDAVNSYTVTRDLSPALGNSKGNIDAIILSNSLIELNTQVSITSSVSEPPEYNEANRQLKPDIAPLPTIDNVNPENPIEAETGHITGRVSPSYSPDRYYHGYDDGSNNIPPPDYMSNPHWWRYRDKNCCHPKNTWHCCWHRETYWSPTYSHMYTEYNTSRSWYNCKGTGFLRCLLLVLMWSCVWPCVGTGFIIYFLCFWCCFCCGCINFDDD